jgi:hypothetical protein
MSTVLFSLQLLPLEMGHPVGRVADIGIERLHHLTICQGFTTCIVKSSAADA